jgi:hypothetical protein
MGNVLFVLAFLVLVSVVAGYAVSEGATAGDIALVGFIAFSAVIVAFAAVVLWEIVDGKINLAGIISEPQDVAGPDGKAKASLSRFQFLVFTFVVAGLFLMLSIEAGTFVNIPNNVLGLIGLSGGGFIVSKAVGHRKPGGSNATGGGTTAANPPPNQQGPGQQASTGDIPAQPSPG